MHVPGVKFSRRTAVDALVPLLIAPLCLTPRPAIAFDNRLPPDEMELKYKTPRNPGPQPMGIGPQPNGGLKPCIDGKPHCFSSSAEVFYDDDLFKADYGTTADWLVSPFKYSKPLEAALSDVKAGIAAYPPGQRGIDGGGFKLIKQTTSTEQAYLYVQFESRRKGYIDDLEILLREGTAEVRTSSRIGYTDLGVNAKRYNYFADYFGSLDGWKATPLLSKGHEQYFSQNGVSDTDMSAARTDAVVKGEKTKLASATSFSPF